MLGNRQQVAVFAVDQSEWLPKRKAGLFVHRERRLELNTGKLFYRQWSISWFIMKFVSALLWTSS